MSTFINMDGRIDVFIFNHIKVHLHENVKGNIKCCSCFKETRVSIHLKGSIFPRQNCGMWNTPDLTISWSGRQTQQHTSLVYGCNEQSVDRNHLFQFDLNSTRSMICNNQKSICAA